MTNHIQIVNRETFDVVQSAVNKMVNTIKPTYGPAGNKIIISKFAYRMAVDDGVQGARDFEITDNPAEDAVVKIVREAPVRTSDRAKDSTTGSLIVLQGIINAVGKKTNWRGRQTKLEIEKGLEEAKEQLRALARPIKTTADMKKTAMVSFDNEEVADMIAGLYAKLGNEAVITVDRSPTMDIYAELSEGITLKETGYLSPYFVTNPERMECVFEKPYFLITDYRLTEAEDVLPLLNKMAEEKIHNLVIIAENVEQAALATLNINLPHVINPHTGRPGVVRSCAIAAPKGENRKTLLEDIALLTGGKFFSESKGDKLELATIKDLGRAVRFVAKREESVIIGPKGKKADIATSLTQLRSAIEAEKEERLKKELIARLALFTNQVAVIKVGAPTENEQKALKYKVENAVNAVKNAIRGGVIPGGGYSLERVKTSSAILNEALKAPRIQLWDNMEVDVSYEGELKENEAYNVVTLQKGDALKVGVIDPVDSIIAGLESAVSIAGILLTSHAIIVEYSKPDNA
jgi:chaperonin GroEL